LTVIDGDGDKTPVGISATIDRMTHGEGAIS